MFRIPEREVMDDPAQVSAYARADFSAVNQGFVDRFVKTLPLSGPARVLDLGCGPADIPIRLARALPEARITAVDASEEMLKTAREAAARAGLGERLRLLHGRLPGLPLPEKSFDAVVSNSLVHQLPEPGVFWGELKRLGKAGAAVFVMDLSRPPSQKRAREIVRAAAADEDPLLKEDFFNSLLAALTPEEAGAQLERAGLASLKIETVSERHWLAWGRL